MKQLKLRYARPDEAEQIMEWMRINPHNHFTANILRYPTLRVICAYEEGGEVVGYVPMHQVMVMESIALKPGVSALTSAQALRDFTKAAELIADAGGMREIWFVGGDAGVGEMAASPKGHSFEEVKLGDKPAKLYRNQLCG